MKLIDYLLVAAFVGCMFIGYSGHRLIAILLLLLVFISLPGAFMIADVQTSPPDVLVN